MFSANENSRRLDSGFVTEDLDSVVGVIYRMLDKEGDVFSLIILDDGHFILRNLFFLFFLRKSICTVSFLGKRSFPSFST